MALSQNQTIAKLAQWLIQQLRAGNETAADSDEDEILAQVKELASQHGADASAESIGELATDIQSQDIESSARIIS